MSKSDIADLQELIEMHQRRLHILEVQSAQSGASTDPRIIIEIRSIRHELQVLQSKHDEALLLAHEHGQAHIAHKRERREYRFLGIPIWSSYTVLYSSIALIVVLLLGFIGYLFANSAQKPEVATINYNGPVGVINSGEIDQLTVYSGDTPEVQEQKAFQRERLIASDVLYYMQNVDGRLGLVETSLTATLPTTVTTQIENARRTTVPILVGEVATKNQQQIEQAQADALRQQLASYPLVSTPSTVLNQLVADSTVPPDDITFYYRQLGEVQWASDMLYEKLINKAHEKSTDPKWLDYDQQSIQLAWDTLKNRSQTAYLAGLQVLANLPRPQDEINTKLAGMQTLEPKHIVVLNELPALMNANLSDTQALTDRRRDLVALGSALLADTSAYESIQATLTINTTDSQHLVIGKAISLRQLGQKDNAIAAFQKYSEMFAASDPTAADYSRTAQAFTNQIKTLGIVDGATYISQIAEGSPAEQAGLKAGDILIQVNGITVQNPPDVQNALSKVPEGETLSVIYLRLLPDGTFARENTRIIFTDGKIGVAMIAI